MPELDITGKVAERAIEMLRTLLQDLDKQVFAGPTGARLSKKEALDRLNDPAEREALLAELGPQEFERQRAALENDA